MTTFVIVGGGHAGAKAAETLRAEGFDGEVVLFADEPVRPYERPPLAKGYLLGKDERESVFVHPAGWYAKNNVDLRLSTPATAIHTAIRTVAFDGGALSYDKLAITTGASSRKIAAPGADLGGVFYLRTLGESEGLRAAFTPDARVVIVGAGWIGLEAAAAARLAGSSVTVIGREPGALYAALGPELGEKFAELGQEVEYNRVPYFYSDQYDLGMECSGLPLPGSYDQIVYRGDGSVLEFIAFWLNEGRLVAGMNVNVWDVATDIEALIRSNRPLDPARLSDPAIPLRDL